MQKIQYKIKTGAASLRDNIKLKSKNYFVRNVKKKQKQFCAKCKIKKLNFFDTRNVRCKLSSGINLEISIKLIDCNLHKKQNK